MSKGILEVCVDSVESAVAAFEGGADRIELCSDLLVGGVTPSETLFHMIRKYTDLKIRVLLRPRFGDFCYSFYELEMMREDVQKFAEMGVEGIVTGILTPTGNLDIEQMKNLISCAGKVDVALHRAFDVCKNPLETMESAISLGIKTILTSGQKNSAWEGRRLLKELQEKSGNRIEILAGAGVDARVIEKLYEETGITSYHLSGKIKKESKMEFRNPQVSMGLPGFDEYEIWQTSKERVENARKVLDKKFKCHLP